MTASPAPMVVQIEGGIDVKTDDATGTRPQRILNAHYARTGALSRRHGYKTEATFLPQDPLPGTDDGYLAFDGDKFFARKNRNGVDFFQRPDGHAVGNVGTHRPELTQLPGLKEGDARQDVLVDIARTNQDFNSWSGSKDVVFYARMDMVSYDDVSGFYSYDIVVDYIAAADSRLTVRAETRIKNAFRASYASRHQLRMMTGVAFVGTSSGIVLVYTASNEGTGTGIYYRVLHPGPTPDADILSPEYVIVNATSTPGPVGAVFNGELAALFDCDMPFPDGGIAVCYAGVAASGTTGGLAFAKVRTSGNLTATTSMVFAPPAGFPISIAIKGIGNAVSTAYEMGYAFVSATATQHEAYCGKFQFTVANPPGTIANDRLTPLTDRVSTMPPMTAVAGVFVHKGSGSSRTAFLAGVNSGTYGFRYMFSDLNQGAFYGVINSINCAWATGRPFSLFDEAGDWIRTVLPMVAWGGELGGGTGLFVDITPPLNYQNNVTRNGAKLLATYAVDQIALTQRQVTTTISSVQVWQAYQNERVSLSPNSGSHVTDGAEFPGKNRVRWLVAVGQPAVPVLVALQDNSADFEFLEPGVMLVGAGVPVLLDAVNGISEIGFPTSPVIMKITTTTSFVPGDGWAQGKILQFRFQYRFVDGLGRAQVSPASEPIQLTAPVADTWFILQVSTLDVTLRASHVLIDIYRTDPNEATFYLVGSLTAEGGEKYAIYTDRGPVNNPAIRAQTINVENYWMTPPCALHAFRGAFRDVLVTRENELWPSSRRLSTTAPQFDIVNSGAWDSYESVITGGEIDGKLIVFSKSKVAYTYEQNGTLAPFAEIPSDTGAVDGSRAFSTQLGVFYQSPAGIRVIGRDMAIHETGLVIQPLVAGLLVRGGVKVPSQGEIRLRLEGAGNVNYYVVFDYFQGTLDQPVWYEYRYNAGDPYTAPDGTDWPRRQFVDQAYGWNGKLIFLCRSGDILAESDDYADLFSWIPVIVRSSSLRGRTAISYLATLEGVVNLEKSSSNEAPTRVTLRLRADYDDSRPSPILVEKSWPDVDGTPHPESFDRRQLQITASADAMNAPAISLEYEDSPVDPYQLPSGDGFGYRLSAMVMIYGERDQKLVFPVANGARK